MSICDNMKSTIGTKVQMAVTGLLLVGFLLTHLLGNTLLFAGADQFNDYAHALTSNPLIYIAEAGLLALFLVHIVSAIKVTMLSKGARPVGYGVNKNLGKSTAASRFMVHTGGLILVFAIVHLVTFKFDKEYSTVGGKTTVNVEIPAIIAGAPSAEVLTKEISKTEKRDLYRTVVERFSNKGYSIFYIICMILLGMHLCHGFKSAFQTLGLSHPKYNGLVSKMSCGLGVFFAVGYSSFPIYFGFIKALTTGA